LGLGSSRCVETIWGEAGSGVPIEALAAVTALRVLAVRVLLPVLNLFFLRSSLSRERARDGGRPETRTVGSGPGIGSGEAVCDVRRFQLPTNLLYTDDDACIIASGWLGGEDDMASGLCGADSYRKPLTRRSQGTSVLCCSHRA
jgi:hypothetical protein